MTVFLAKSDKGNLSLGSNYNRARFSQFLKDNDGIRLRIEPETPENRKQRKFFEGAVVPLIAYYQEGKDYRNPDDLDEIREWLKMEFNPKMVVVSGKTQKVAGSTKGKLQDGFLEKVLDWITDQSYKTELLKPEDYKYWKDTIYAFGGPADYISYLISLNKLP